MRARIAFLRTRQAISRCFYVSPTPKEYEAMKECVPFPYIELWQDHCAPAHPTDPVPSRLRDAQRPGLSVEEQKKSNQAALRRFGSMSDPVFWVVPEMLRTPIGKMGSAGVVLMIPVLLLAELLTTPFMVYLMLRVVVQEARYDWRELVAWLRQTEKS